MHLLNRSAVTAPACLADYNWQQHTWGDLRGECKKQLRLALFEMQGITGITSADAKEYGLRCAYCESAIRHEGHIEHFRRKNRRRPDGYPELTFDWNNLFLACRSQSHCGHFKDRPAASPYEVDDLIKPDVDNPDAFLFFHSSGDVRARSGLVAADDNRARETIRVFGLNDPALSAARAKAVASYRRLLETDLEELASWEDAERREYIEGEIAAAHWQPYATAIRHFFLIQSR